MTARNIVKSLIKQALETAKASDVPTYHAQDFLLGALTVELEAAMAALAGSHYLEVLLRRIEELPARKEQAQ